MARRRYTIPNFGTDAGVPLIAPRIYPDVDPLAAVLHTFLTSLDQRDERKAEGRRADLAERKFQSEERVTQATLAAKLQELLFKEQELGAKATEREEQRKALQKIGLLRAPVTTEQDEEITAGVTYPRREPIQRTRVIEPDDDVLEGAMQTERADPADAATRARLREQLTQFLDLGETEPGMVTVPGTSQRVRTTRPPTLDEYKDRLGQVDMGKVPAGFLELAKLLAPPDPTDDARKRVDLMKARTDLRVAMLAADNEPEKQAHLRALQALELEIKRLDAKDKQTKREIIDEGLSGKPLTDTQKTVAGLRAPEPGREPGKGLTGYVKDALASMGVDERDATPAQIQQATREAEARRTREAEGRVPSQVNRERQKVFDEVDLAAQDAMRVLDRFEALAAKLPVGSATERATGALGRELGALTQSNPDAAEFRKQAGAVSLLARTLGEKGVLTDRDVTRVQEMLPGLHDTTEIKQRQIAAIRSFIQGRVAAARAKLHEPLGGEAPTRVPPPPPGFVPVR